MQINTIETNPAQSSYFTAEYIQLVEDYLSYFKQLERSTTLAVGDHQNYKYEGDFYGLLADLNIDKKYYYLVLRINGLSSSDEFDGTISVVVIPPFDEIETIKLSQQVNS